MFSLFTRSGLIQILLSLPAVFLSLSFHEAAHAFIAYKLGDPTARNLGRLTLNPMKHIDIIGFLCMLLARIGWAKPVPINARNFKKPRRDMALSSAAGPLSNLLLALISFGILRIILAVISGPLSNDLSEVLSGAISGSYIEVSNIFKALSVLVYIIYYCVILNISLAIFNLLPLPPFDGSRIAYVFLPSKVYFGIMKYENYIYIGVLAILLLGFLDFPLNWLFGKTMKGLLFVTGMSDDHVLDLVLYYIDTLIFA